MRLHDRLTRAAGIRPGRPDLTGRAPRDGWPSTDDAGCLDQDGPLFVAGEIVYLAEAEAEDAPCRRAAAAEAAVARADDQRPGQLVHALIASAAAERPDLAEIMALGQDHRVGYTYPRSAGSAACSR